MFKDAWDMRLAQAKQATKHLKANVIEIEKKIETALDRMVETDSSAVIAAFEKRITKLEREKALAEEKLAANGKPRLTWEESFEHALHFLSSPWKIWKNADLIGKKTVLRLAFLEPLAYSRIEGLRTPNLSMPFRILGDFPPPESEMAHRGRFELPTPRFVVW